MGDAPFTRPGNRLLLQNGTDVMELATANGGLVQSLNGAPDTLVGGRSQAEQALLQLYAYTGIDPARSMSYVHTFDAGDAGWTTESRTAAGAVATTAPVAVAEWDGNPSIQSNGTDSISRGWVRNVAGTFTNHNPRTVILDQNTPWGMACKFQMITDSGGYILFGASDPTSTGVGPKGVYCGFEHGTNSQFYEGYKTNTGGGVGVDTAASTVQLDGNWHRGFVFCDSSGFYKFSIDGETPIAMPNVNTFSNLLASMRICFAVAGNGRVSWSTAVWPVFS